MSFMIVASALDQAAAALATSWEKYGAVLVTPRLLSERGWKYEVGQAGLSRGVGHRGPFEAASIRCAYSRLTIVGDHDVRHIMPEDRRYVAAEMQAFLVAWLTEIPCPVLNAPTPISLAGPGWTSHRWTSLATEADFPLSLSGEASAWDFDRPPGFVPRHLSVIDGKVAQDCPDFIRQRCARLAGLADIPLFTVSIDDVGHYRAACDGLAVLDEPTERNLFDCMSRTAGLVGV